MNTNTKKPPLDANSLEEMAKANPDEKFLKGSGVLKLIGAIRTLESQLRSERAARLTAPHQLLQALRFYAAGDHFTIDGDCQEFDTVSGEPENWQMSQKDDDCTMFEDGTVARLALQGKLNWNFDDAEDEPKPVEGEAFAAQAPAAETVAAPAGDAPMPVIGRFEFVAEDVAWMEVVDDSDPESPNSARLVRQSDALAALAAKDAEIARLESAWQVDTMRRKDGIIAVQEEQNDKLRAELATMTAERDALATQVKATEDREALLAGSEESIPLKPASAHGLEGNAAAAYDQCRVMVALWEAFRWSHDYADALREPTTFSDSVVREKGRLMHAFGRSYAGDWNEVTHMAAAFGRFSYFKGWRAAEHAHGIKSAP